MKRITIIHSCLSCPKRKASECKIWDVLTPHSQAGLFKDETIFWGCSELDLIKTIETRLSDPKGLAATFQDENGMDHFVSQNVKARKELNEIINMIK